MILSHIRNNSINRLKSHDSTSNRVNLVNPHGLRLRVMRLILNIIFSGVIVILAYISTTAFRFTSWLLSVNKGIKD